MTEPMHVTIARTLQTMVAYMRSEKQRTGKVPPESFEAADEMCGLMIEAMPRPEPAYRP